MLPIRPGHIPIILEPMPQGGQRNSLAKSTLLILRILLQNTVIITIAESRNYYHQTPTALPTTARLKQSLQTIMLWLKEQEKFTIKYQQNTKMPITS